jgi:hypothetical protein
MINRINSSLVTAQIQNPFTRTCHQVLHVSMTFNAIQKYVRTVCAGEGMRAIHAQVMRTALGITIAISSKARVYNGKCAYLQREKTLTALRIGSARIIKCAHRYSTPLLSSANKGGKLMSSE